MSEIKNISENIKNEESQRDNKNLQKRVNEEMYDFFKDFILKSKVYKEKEVAPGFSVRVRALSAEEIIEAESVVATLSDYLIVSDVAVRIRSCSILSYAVEKLGDNEIYTQEELDAVTKEAKDMANLKRASMYNNLMKLPPLLLNKVYDLYLEAVKEQNELYSDPEKVGEKSKNFSKHPSEE